MSNRYSNEKTKVRLFSKIKITENGCWEFQGWRDRDGYGRFQAFNTRRAHRVSYILSHGPIFSDDLLVCHKCDNPPCINPDHLFLGTHKVNHTDRGNKGRQDNGRSKLTHCAQGHEYNEENTRWKKNGKHRVCKTRARKSVRDVYYKNKVQNG